LVYPALRASLAELRRLPATELLRLRQDRLRRLATFVSES